MEIVKMDQNHYHEVLSMVKKFYNSPAVSHAVPEEVLIRTLTEAVSDSPILDGYVFQEEGQAVGFGYVTSFYACEAGGICVMIEEVYLEESCRGKGYGSEFFHFVFNHYKNAKRFRLEITEENKKAKKLYEKLGFEMLDYGQMVKDLI